jgi:hypothetical protein
MKTGGVMQRKMKERWLLLCEQAATEQDPAKLMGLIEEVNCLLEAEENRRRETRAARHVNLKRPQDELDR